MSKVDIPETGLLEREGVGARAIPDLIFTVVFFSEGGGGKSMVQAPGSCNIAEVAQVHCFCLHLRTTARRAAMPGVEFSRWTRPSPSGNKEWSLRLRQRLRQKLVFNSL